MEDSLTSCDPNVGLIVTLIHAYVHKDHQRAAKPSTSQTPASEAALHTAQS